MSNVYSVGQVNRYVKNMFTADYFLRKLDVRGEVSNCKYHTSGHVYFSLKDETGALSCVMFAGRRKDGLGFPMRDGDQVIVTGTVDVYERDGRYQMYASRITKDGLGALHERFLQLKQELEDMGMFDDSYKKPIPRLVRRLGVVTAPTGAAIQDIRNVSYRRNPGVQIILSPALVQGKEAAPSIVKALDRLDKLGVDVIILGRGGGSLEDLWAFNEEPVARAIFDCQTPVISAVGHETDFTIADFVADLRAPTPSAAAELAVADVSALFSAMQGFSVRMDQSMRRTLALYRGRLEQDRLRLLHAGPAHRLRENQQTLAVLSEKLDRAMGEQVSNRRNRLALLAERLEGLSPVHRLQQGYSYVADDAGRAVRSVTQVRTGQRLRVHVTDGAFAVEVRSESI